MAHGASHDGILLECVHPISHGLSTRRLSYYSDTRWISSKSFDVVSYPYYRCISVQKSNVLYSVQGSRKAKYIHAEVEGDHNYILSVGEMLTIVIRRVASTGRVAPTMYPNHYWFGFLAGFGPHIQRETIFALCMITLIDKVGIYSRILRRCLRIYKICSLVLRAIITL